MKLKQVREEVLFYGVSIATFLFLLLLSVFFLHREQTHSQQMLEINTFRLAADLMESLRARPTLRLEDLPKDIVGFGVYDGEGRVLNRYGTAPASIRSLLTEAELSWGRINRIDFRSNRLLILRTVGIMPMDRDAMRGMWGRMRGYSPPMDSPPPPAARVVYLEIDIKDWQSSQRFLRIGFFVIPLLLSLIFLGTTLMYRKNLSYRKTEQKNRELVQLGEAARTLAHEIKNPLGVIRIQTATLQKVLPPTHHPNLKIITEEVDRLRMLVDKVGDFLKNPVGNPEPLDAVAFTKELIGRFPISIAFSVPQKEPKTLWVRIDRDRFRTILENILKNAVESLPVRESQEPGTQEETQKEQGELILVKIIAEGNQVVIEVKDRGCGLPKGSEERIFDPFFTTKPTGSGIGLSISKRFVEVAGGKLSVIPREGGGTEVKIVLPKISEEGHARFSN
ncbi:MAG: HAMP domain-containing sensor histidine kinase [Spirochaetales bacterium]